MIDQPLLPETNQLNESEQNEVDSIFSIIQMIAEVAHEVNRSYCNFIDDNVLAEWSNVSDHIKESIYAGILYRIENPNATPEDNHKSWMKTKLSQGWAYSKTRNDELKLHPNLVPYNKLPTSQRLKDTLFSSVVDTLIKQYNLRVE